MSSEAMMLQDKNEGIFVETESVPIPQASEEPLDRVLRGTGFVGCVECLGCTGRIRQEWGIESMECSRFDRQVTVGEAVMCCGNPSPEQAANSKSYI